MTKTDLIKSFIKHRILLPITHGLALDKNKTFVSCLNFLLTILPCSEATVARLKGDFLLRTSHFPPPQAKTTDEPATTKFIRPTGEPVSYPPVRLIAFYLPQFHEIPENNKWWGDGFTEWTNVKSASPQFSGHYQPQQPGELGYYNLDNIEVMKRQAELAKLYGVGGFCFYFYWFAGKRLLEKPIIQYFEARDIELPFCLCWANENWSRRWDGLDKEILISQDHSEEDDIAFIKYISKYFNDPRYIRLNDKPLLLVYRPSLLPSPKQTVQLWRKWCKDNGVGEIYLAYTQSFETVDPKEYGFDAAIEFPPNNSGPPVITENVLSRNDDFTGKIYDWNVFPKRSEQYQQPDYTLFRGVCPSWDNTARLKNNSAIFLNSSPQGYQKWLTNAVFDTAARFSKRDERLVFVNAWNEWAEGAYLEPNKKLGFAYLEATQKALAYSAKKLIGRRIVLVSHDAYLHGAQYLTLNMAKMLNKSMGYKVDLIVLGEGPLIEEFQKYANVHELAGHAVQDEKVVNLVAKLFHQGATSAITNTTVSGLIVPVLKQCGYKVISLIHELPQLINDYELQNHVDAISQYADKIVFAASAVRVGFESFTSLAPDKVVLRPQGLYKKNRCQSAAVIQQAHSNLRKRFNLSQKAKIVLAVGFADYRKGIDIFVESGIEILQQGYEVYFLWLGNFEPQLEAEIKETISESGFANFFIFPGSDYDTDIYYAGADIYALTSREDPFPSVVMEALDVQTPVVAFSASGGSAELLAKGGGVLVDKMTSQAFTTTLIKLITDPNRVTQLGREGKKIIDEDFSFHSYMFDILDLLQSGLHRISVVVPNYNYEKYIKERLQSIISQNYPIFEIIVLDDASTDNSVKIIRETLKSQLINYKIIINNENSGSVFTQWKKGVDLAQGTHIWIAEADDSSCCDFLEEVVEGFETSGVVLSYSESKQIDENGKIMADNYREYVADIDTQHWMTPFVKDGHEEIANVLSVKNTIPNVSGVLFEKSCLKAVLEEHINRIRRYRVAGDWLVYVLILKSGKIAFSPLSLNLHRRHPQGVTIGNFNEQQLNEIQSMQKFVAKEFNVPDEILEISLQYIETLKVQFDLVSQ